MASRTALRTMRPSLAPGALSVSARRAVAAPALRPFSTSPLVAEQGDKGV